MSDYCFVYPFSDQFFDANGANPPLAWSQLRDTFSANLRNLLKTLNISDATATAIGNCLFERMADRNLHYHTPVHVLALLDFAQKRRIPATPENGSCSTGC